jgi:hypothetical protein
MQADCAVNNEANPTDIQICNDPGYRYYFCVTIAKAYKV